MNNEVNSLMQRIEELERKFREFTNAAELDPQIQRTISQILSNSSSKSATSENRTVNESGASSYSVLNPPDRFIRIGDNNIPAYDS